MPSQIRTATILFAGLTLAALAWMIHDANERPPSSGISPTTGELPGREHQSAELATPVPLELSLPAEPLQSSRLVEDTLDNRAAVKVELASIIGRAMIGPRPAKSTLIQLSRVDTRYGPRSWKIIEKSPDILTDHAGQFRHTGLAPGTYRLQGSATDGSVAYFADVHFKLEPGENRRLHDLILRKQVVEGKKTNKDRRAHRMESIVNVQTSTPGVVVKVVSPGQSFFAREVKTDENGLATLKWRSEGRARIDVLSPTGQVIGSTGQYSEYPEGRSDVRIETDAGSLQILLPSGHGAQPEEAVQYLVNSQDEQFPVSLNETVRGSSPNKNDPGVRSTLDSVTFSVLPAGSYNVEALRMRKNAEGRWYASGDRWYGTGHVSSAGANVCRLR